MNICASLLMAPTQACWNAIAEPPNQCLLERVKQAALMPFAMIGVFFTLPMFFFGAYLQLIIWPISMLICLVPRLQPGFLEIEIYPRYPEVEADFVSLQRLKALSQNPTRRNFDDLPELQQYLIAANHTYPYLRGWYFTSKEEIQRIFLNTIVDDLSHASTAIRKAITSQEGIVFAKTLKIEFQRGNFPQAVINDGQYHFHNIVRRMARRLGDEDNIAYARHFIQANPRDLRIQDVLQEEIEFLCGGW